MTYGKLKIILLTILLVGTGLFFGIKTFAQTPTNYDVTVSPVFFDLSGNPGDLVSDKIRIRNNTTSALPIRLGVKRLTGDVNGDLTLKEDANDETLSWVKFANTTVTAKPLEWTDVEFTIQVPKDAAFGYYFAITFSQDNNSPLAQTGTAITGVAAVPILLNVRKEGAKAQGKILEFAPKNYVNEYLPVDFIVRVENVGNIHIRPHGNIFISDGGNKDLGILDVNLASGNIIPATKRNFDTSWTDGFIVKEPVIEDGQVKQDKNGKVVEKITINWNKLTSFRIGKYTANLILVFDNGTRDVSLESTATFWVFPWKVVILTLITIVVLILLIRFLLKAYVKKELRKKIE